MKPADAACETVAFAAERALLATAAGDTELAAVLTRFAGRAWGRMQICSIAPEDRPEPRLYELARSGMEALHEAGLLTFGKEQEA